MNALFTQIETYKNEFEYWTGYQIWQMLKSAPQEIFYWARMLAEIYRIDGELTYGLSPTVKRDLQRFRHQHVDPMQHTLEDLRLLWDDEQSRNLLLREYRRLRMSAPRDAAVLGLAYTVGTLLPLIIFHSVSRNRRALIDVFGFLPARFPRLFATLQRLLRQLRRAREEIKFVGEIDTRIDYFVEPAPPLGLESGAQHRSMVGARASVLARQALTFPGDTQATLARSELATFAERPRPVTLLPGTKIYRVVARDGQRNAPYWSLELPRSEASWRSRYAVLREWNKNGFYVEHTVGERGLNAWLGPTASQQLVEFPEWLQVGGGEQLVIPQARAHIASDLSLQPTAWRY